MANQRYLLRHIPKHIPHNVNKYRNVLGAKYKIGDKVYVDNYWKTHIMDVWKDKNGEIWYQIAYPQTRSSIGNDGFKIVREDYIEGKINESKTSYNMEKKLIRLTESDLHKIVKESVNRVMNEEFSQNDVDALRKHKLGIEIREFTGLINSLVNSYSPTGNEAFDHNMKELSYRYFNHLKPMIEGFLN